MGIVLVEGIVPRTVEVDAATVVADDAACNLVLLRMRGDAVPFIIAGIVPVEGIVPRPITEIDAIFVVNQLVIFDYRVTGIFEVNAIFVISESQVFYCDITTVNAVNCSHIKR